MKKIIKRLVLIIPVICIVVTVICCLGYEKKHYSVFENADVRQVQKKIDEGQKVVVYYGSETCGDCIEFAPILKDIMEEAGVQVHYIDADNRKNEKFINTYELKVTPTFLVFKNGEETGRYTDHMVYDGMANIYNEEVCAK